MNEEPDQPDRKAIYVPDDVAEAAGVPDDLDSEVVGPYAVPDTARRRRAGVVYFIAAAITALLMVTGLPSLMWATAVGALVVVGGYHFVAGWRLRIREGKALEIANREVGFAVGHASASLGFTGWRARPVWNVLVFSADEPPSQRGLVRVDALTARVVDSYTESVAEPAV
jgi:hypothetical protein